MAPDAESSLAALIALLAGQDWCIIGGAATALYLDDWHDTADIDVVLRKVVLARLLKQGVILDKTDGGTARFRSGLYAGWALPLPIDFLADFEVNVGGVWQPVWPVTRQPMRLATGTVYVPCPQEHLAITLRLGRPHDLARLERMQAAGIG